MGGYNDGLHHAITYIQRTHGYMIVIDRFSKAALFGTLPATFSAYQAGVGNIISKLHGYPKSIISDRGTIFLSKL